jgi:hypothetical protein
MKKRFNLWDKLPALNRLFQSSSKSSLSASVISRATPFVDVAFYQEQSSQQFANSRDAVEHFLTTGWQHNFSPCIAFSVSHYLSAYPDISEAGINPLLHFLESGWQESRLAFSVEGHINELIGYDKDQLVLLGKRPLNIHLTWTACNRLAGWVAGMQSQSRDVEISVPSGLIGRARLQKPSLHSGDITHHHFEFYVESPASPVTAKFVDGKNNAETTLDSNPPSRSGFSNVEEFLQRPISANTTAIAPCSKELVKAFITEKRTLARLAEETESNNDKVSIVMPVFNRGTLVASAMTSVAKQRYSNWELIIVDDGSTDKSLDVIDDTIKKLGIESKTRVLALETNMGVSRARNEGLTLTEAPVIAYLDSDNTWDTDYLSLVMEVFETNPDANSLYAGQYVYFYNEVTRRRYLAGLRLQPFNRELLEQENYIDLNIFAHRRTLYEQLGGFNEQMRRLVDWDLILRYTKEQPPRLIPALLAQYNMGIVENQITNQEDLRKNLEFINRQARDKERI